MSQIQDDGRDEYEMEATRAPNRAPGKIVAFLAVFFGFAFGIFAQDFNTGVVAGIWVVLIYYAPHPDYNLWHGLIVLGISLVILLGLGVMGVETRDRVTAALVTGAIITAIDSMLIRARR